MNDEKNIKFDVFIKGERVDLVVLSEEIVEKTNWYNWFNDEENTKYMQQHYFPNTKTFQLEYFKNEIENSKNKLQLCIYHKNDQIMIGTISLNNINYLHRKCSISGFIGEKKYQSLKPFIEANKLLIKHAFEQLNMNRIYGGSMRKSVTDMFVKLLKFENEGILKEDVFKNNKYYDVYLIGLSKNNYNSE
jgi:[ribosomal protein S5]-alanine N-acetyltransferase